VKSGAEDSRLPKSPFRPLEQRRRYAFDAWAEYLATGLHVSDEESDAWLARLETGDVAEPPVAHG
jgi:hypothetical protein